MTRLWVALATVCSHSDWVDAVGTIGLLSVCVAALGILATALFRLDGKLDAGFARLESRMDAKFDRVDARFDRVDERLSVLELRLEHHLDTH